MAIALPLVDPLEQRADLILRKAFALERHERGGLPDALSGLVLVAAAAIIK